MMSGTSYAYCPYCATPLEDRPFGGRLRRVCPSCGFIHFKDPKVAVIGQIEQAGKILLVRRAVNPARGRWALPGGYMDAGEMPESALRREILEEVGLVVVVRNLLAIYPMANVGETSLGIVLAYRAHPTQSDAVLRPQDDISEARWFGPTGVPSDLAFESTHEQLRTWVATHAGDRLPTLDGEPTTAAGKSRSSRV